MSSDVLDRPFHGVAVYNPDLLSKDELIEQFVARQQLLDELLSDLRRPNFTQHQLLVGSRGMGKTTLLRRLRFAVDDDPELNAQWMPLTFPEEQYNVARLSDFYLNVIDALGDTLEQRGRRDEAAVLDAAVEGIPQGDETRRSEAALAVLLQAADRIDRRLLLLVDNLDLVLGRLEKQNGAQWSFRELLSREQRILLIGATPVFIGATYDYDAPFYDFFRVNELHGLTREETRDVLVRLATQRGTAEVERVVREDPGRIDTLHTLTAGNPRTIVLLFNILAQGTEGDVRTDLEKLLDQCTPLYKARFEAMAPQQQQVVDRLALHWDPITAGELAEKLALDVNTVSAQLARLVQQGVLERVEYHPSTKIGFQIAERFFNIWYLMRASRRVRRRLLWLVEFLRLFYGVSHLKQKASELLNSSQLSPRADRVRDVEFCLAIAEAMQDDWPTRATLESYAIRTLVRDDNLRYEIRGMLDLDGTDAALREVVDREQWLNDCDHAAAEIDLPEGEKSAIVSLIKSGLDSRAEKLETLRTWNQTRQDERTEIVRELTQVVVILDQGIGTATTRALLQALREGFMDGAYDEAGARSAARALGLPALEVVFRADASAATLAKILETANDAFVQVAYADAIMREDGDLDQALLIVEGVRSKEDFEYAAHVAGDLFFAKNRFDDAAEAFQCALSLKSEHQVLSSKLALCHFMAGRFEEALSSSQSATQRSTRLAVIEAAALIALRRLDEARDALRELPCDDLDGRNGIAAAAMYFKLDLPDNALALLRRTLPRAAAASLKEELPHFLKVFSIAVKRGHAASIYSLIDELGLKDSLRPAYEALEVFAARDRHRIRRLAPELREPVTVLLDQWGLVDPEKKTKTERKPHSTKG